MVHETIVSPGRNESPIKLTTSYQAFLRDLPKLLREHPHQWVAYSGEKQLAVGSSKRLLHRQCMAAGYREEDFLICSIEAPQQATLDPLLDV